MKGYIKRKFASLLLFSTVVSVFIYLKQKQQMFTEHISSFSSNQKTSNVVVSIDRNIYLLAATIVHLSESAKHTYHYDKVISLQVWVKGKSKKYFCCFVLLNGTGYCVSVLATFTDYSNIPLHSVDVVCPMDKNESSVKFVTVISESWLTNVWKKSEAVSLFQNNKNSFISPTPATDAYVNGLAICSHITYKTANAAHLIEWFEAQRLLGIDKIMTFTYKLYAEAMRVLEFYESEGLLVIMRDFSFPEKDKYQRDVGDNGFMAWSDENQVDRLCQSRFYNYKYVMVLDKDEFLFLNYSKYGFSVKSYLDSIFSDKLAGIALYTKLHITNLGTIDNSSQLFIGRYLNGTIPVPDRMKNIIVSSRIKLGSLWSHNFKPLKGFTKFVVIDGKFSQDTNNSRTFESLDWSAKFIVRIYWSICHKATFLRNKLDYTLCYGRKRANSNDLVIHHYRKCRNNGYKIGDEKGFYFKKSIGNCEGIKQVYQKDMMFVADKIKGKVLAVKKYLKMH